MSVKPRTDELRKEEEEGVVRGGEDHRINAQKVRTYAALTDSVLVVAAEAEAVSVETGGRGDPAKEGMAGVATAWK